jgi:uncharacterized delta-60 repeat protein
MKTLGRSWGTAAACFLVGLVWFVGMAKADPMAVQPDGKIVVLGRTNPEFGALARLNPDGSLDQGFGSGGYAIDKRILGLTSVGVQPDGRIVAGVFGAFQPARYLAEGAIDPSFAGGAVGGGDEPAFEHFFNSIGRDPLLLRPDGSIIVAKNLTMLGAGDGEAWVKRYDASGNLAETVGHVPPLTGPGDTSLLRDLLEDEGRLYGAGSTYDISTIDLKAFLARFLPGSGTDYDSSFAGGSGFARPDLPVTERSSSSFSALAEQGGKLLAAGRTEQTLLLSRFEADGSLDTSFGDGGSVTPDVPSVGSTPAGTPNPVTSWANDVATTAGDRIVAAGATTQGATWTATKSLGVHCEECPQPLLARFDADGALDHGFGSGGLLRLRRPDGGTFVGEIEQVTVVTDGELLLEGWVPGAGSGPSQVPFVARLNPDGSYDPGFGSGGLAVLDFPCTDESIRQKRSLGCVPRLRPHLRVFGLRRGRPAIVLRAKPSEPWAGIYEMSLTLPPGIRLKKGYRTKLHVVPVGSTEAGKMEISAIKPSKRRRTTTLLLQKLGIAQEVKVRLPRASLRVTHRLPRHRKVKIRVRGDFTHLRWGRDAGYDEAVRRVG